ncbi:MAG: ImmA/IrrE family metallo-endopeptidase [Candidatus Thiodiazotropha taylori]|nr:ImmA/IrrE family metallo-endopeptidase [Candidatus Thiodiazotropha taylori]
MTYKRSELSQIALKHLADANLYSAPIDVDSLAHHIGAEVRYEPLEDKMSGFLVIKGNHSTIVINSEHHPNRQRFTLAHELGHLVLHANNDHQDVLFVDKSIITKKETYNRDELSGKGEYKQEIEANRFAAELLMPRKLLKDAVKEEGDDVDFSDDLLIYKLAQKFGVSEQALSIRLTDLKMLSISY